MTTREWALNLLEYAVYTAVDDGMMMAHIDTKAADGTARTIHLLVPKAVMEEVFAEKFPEAWNSRTAPR